MDLGDIIGGVGKLGKAGIELDPRKVLDLVNDLWAVRRRIVEAVEFVIDNRGALLATMAFVQDHADDLLELARQLPELLGVAGDALESAGGGAKEASAFLLGGATQSVLQLTAETADALERTHRELQAIKSLYDAAGAQLVAIPVVGPAARPLIEGASRLSDVAFDVGAIGARLRAVGVAIDETGHGLDRVGSALTTSGTNLQRLRPEPTPPAKRKPAAKKTPTAAAKKPPAAKKPTRQTK